MKTRKKFGIAYSAQEVRDELERAKSQEKEYESYFVGLIFKVRNESSEDNNLLEILSVFLNKEDGSQKWNLSSSPSQLKNICDYIWVEDSNTDTLICKHGEGEFPNGGIRRGEHFEFQNDPEIPFAFSFFSNDQLQIISAVTDEVILSGSMINTGVVAFPESKGSKTFTKFTNLQIEANRHKPSSLFLSPETGLSYPLIMFGTDCPPTWNPPMSLNRPISEQLIDSVGIVSSGDKIIEYQRIWREFAELNSQ